MNVSSKVTLYDMLAMVIPGFLLLLLLQLSICGDCCPDIPCSNNSLITGTLIFIASYVVGLIYHRIAIIEGLKWIKKLSNCDIYICQKIPQWIILIVNFRNNHKRIKKIGEEFDEEKKRMQIKQGADKHSLDEYFKAYYSLMEKNCLNSIPVLEVQVAFVRNILPIVILYCILLINSGTKIHEFVKINLTLKPDDIALTLFVITIVLIWTMVKIQDKIYELVWEGNEYLK